MNQTNNQKKMLDDDRILVIRPKDGQKAKMSTGLVDTRLFTGENNLHVYLDHNTGLWGMRYDKGDIPQTLKQKFTKYSSLMTFARAYFASRNLEIIEVKA